MTGRRRPGARRRGRPGRPGRAGGSTATGPLRCVVNYESGPALPGLRRGPAGRAAGASWWSSTTVRRTGPSTSWRRPSRTPGWCVTGRNLGYGAAANRGVAATTAPSVLVCNPDLVVRPGRAGRPGRRRSTPTPAAHWSGRWSGRPDGDRYPVRPAVPVDGRRRRPRPARHLRPGQPLHPVLPAAGLDRRRRRGAAGGLGVGGLLPGPAAGLRAGRRLRRVLLHVRRGRGPLLAPRPGGLGGRPTCPPPR